MFTRAICPVLVVVLTCAGTATADTVFIGASQDNTLYESDTGGLSNGGGQYFFAGRTAQGDGSIRRGLLAFDIAGDVPAGSIITDVSLALHMSKTITGPQDVALHRSLADWGEGASDAPGQEGAGTAAAMGDATWLHTFYDTDFWATAGGDYAAVPSATTSVADVGYYSWTSADMVADVQEWLDTPDENYGWFLVGNELTLATAKRFDTRENPTADFRPVLTVEYVPEPASLALLLLGAAAVVTRRR